MPYRDFAEIGKHPAPLEAVQRAFGRDQAAQWVARLAESVEKRRRC